MAGPSNQPAYFHSSSSSSHHPTLPSFHDFSAFADRNDLGIGPSTRPSTNRPFRPPDNTQRHFMSEVNAAHAGPNGSSSSAREYKDHPPMTGDPAFDILDWYPAYQSCQRYFLDVAQHEPGTQALCALINIRLPFQHLTNPINSSSANSADNNNSSSNRSPQSGAQPSTSTYQFTFPHNSTTNNNPSSRTRQQATPFISLLPYLRRLVVTGFDKAPILHGFFGDDYTRGILPHLDCERRNYLFTAKHGGWRTCKMQYDSGSGLGDGCGGGDETVPFMKPLDGVRAEELLAAEKAWGKWLAMEDWMVGPYAPREGDVGEDVGGVVGRQMRGGEERDTAFLPDGAGEAFGGPA